MERLFIGTAGIPLSAESRSTEGGIMHVKKLGLDAMEMEFVRGVRMSDEKAVQAGELAKKQGILLTAHGPYYINLNSDNRAISERSIERIYRTAKAGHLAGAYSITFHAGYRMGRKGIYPIFKEMLGRAVQRLKDNGISVWVRPELTGKPSQFGDLHEIIRLSQELDMVLPCIDFAHLHARFNGKYNSIPEWREFFSEYEKGLGKQALREMHIHFSGINYSEKGERSHLTLEESDLNYKDLLKVWKEFKIAGIAISESPNIEGDALLVKRLYCD